jgi:hypothetical protein
MFDRDSRYDGCGRIKRTRNSADRISQIDAAFVGSNTFTLSRHAIASCRFRQTPPATNAHRIDEHVPRGLIGITVWGFGAANRASEHRSGVVVMRSLLIVTLVAASLAYIAVTALPTSHDREMQVARVTRILAQGSDPAPSLPIAAEQPGLRQPVVASPPQADWYTTFARSAAVVDPQKLGPSAESASIPSTPKAAATAPASWNVTINSTGPFTAGGEASAAQRLQTVRALQSELKRAGCYEGRVDGSWGRSTQQAMLRFLDSVNGSLPVDEPDPILLRLVQGHDGVVCGGQPCRSSSSSADGLCQSWSVIASPASPRSQPLTTAASRAAPMPESAVQPLPGRMSIGGPQPSDIQTASQSDAPPDAVSEPLPWHRKTGPSERLGQQRTHDDMTPKLAALDPAKFTASNPNGTNPSEARSVAAPATIDDGENDRPRERATRERRERKLPVQRATKSFDQKKPTAPKRRQTYATRSVQSLFLHPLGRM